MNGWFPRNTQIVKNDKTKQLLTFPPVPGLGNPRDRVRTGPCPSVSAMHLEEGLYEALIGLGDVTSPRSHPHRIC